MGREGEQAMVGRGLLEDPGRRHLEFGLDGAPDPLRAVPELGPWVVAHHATRYRRIAAIPPHARKRSWPSAAPSWSACRTWSSPYAARPPSSLWISSISRWTRDFSRIRSRPLRISRDFSTSSRRPYSSV